MKSGNFKIEGNFFAFISLHKKIFSGKKDWHYPQYESIYKNETDVIKEVLILSSSPRCEKGVTHFMVEKLAEGMKKADANVEILFPARMKINPCAGCFTCFARNEKKCIYHEKDEMKNFINSGEEIEDGEKLEFIIKSKPIIQELNDLIALKNPGLDKISQKKTAKPSPTAHAVLVIHN